MVRSRALRRKAAVSPWRIWVVVGVGVLVTVGGVLLLARMDALAAGPVLAGAMLLLIVSYASPTIGISLWLAVTVVVPDWTRVEVGIGSLRPLTAVGIVVVIGVLLGRRFRRTRLGFADLALAVASVLMCVFVALESYPLFVVANFVSVLFLSYVVGRVAPDGVKRVFLCAMLFVAVWGIIEFVLGMHVWEHWMPSNEHHWNDIQTRVGLDRSEASFGHSIAYGAALASGIPFTQLLRRPWIGQLLLIAGIGVSLARGPYLAAALTLGLTVIVLGGVRGRSTITRYLVLVATIVAIVLFFQVLYSSESESEVVRSGQTRLNQLANTLPHVQPFGSLSLSYEDGRLETAGDSVIDNTFLRLAINYGWVTMLLIVTPIVAVTAQFFRRRFSMASIAVIGQLPVLATASLIVQWQGLLFFLAGLAIADLRESGPPTDADGTGLHVGKVR